MKNKITRQYVSSIILVFLLLFSMVVYIFSSFYRSSVERINELGVKNMRSEAAMIENYLAKSADILMENI